MVATMHPRSRTTTGLFGATLAVSFMVVCLPHVLPCPVPRTSFADSELTEDGRRKRRRRPAVETQEDQLDQTQSTAIPTQVTALKSAAKEAEILRQQSRECPVPKPTGIVGRVLGFKDVPEKKEKPEIRIDERKSRG